MRTASFTALAAIALGAAACTKEGAGNDVSTEVNLAEDSAANDVLGASATGNESAALPTDAAGFASAAAASDLYEIESAGLAASKGVSADVKGMAGHLKADHEQSTADLKAAAAEAKVTLAPALDAEKQAMLDQLKAASGAEFDRLFIEQQKAAHAKALALLEGYAAGGDHAALKGFAAKAASAVKSHIEHLGSIKL